MSEPSVLDYVKSKIAFWSHSSVEIPAPDQPMVETGEVDVAGDSDQTALAGEGSAPDPSLAADTGLAPAADSQPSMAITGVLLALGALILALFAQSMLEPPNRAAIPAAAFYILAGVLIGIAYFRSLIVPAAIPEYPDIDEMIGESEFLEETSQPPRAKEIDLNLLSFVAGLVLMLATFFLFSTPEGQEVPLFDLVNTAVWLLSIGYLARAFYLSSGEHRLVRIRARLAVFLKSPGWQVKVTRWTVAVLVVIAVVLFFRFYRLNSVPLDAVSDQAEKLLDVNDVLHGTYRVFFPRNTGREAFQFFWTVLIIKIFNTGVTFLSLKIGTALIGLLALYYMYRIGDELGNRWIGLLAVLFCGFSYWAQTQARIALRFTLYAGFYAPMLYYLLRGLRHSNRNDFIWAGIWLGIGLHGYTSYRIVPFVALVCFGIYLLHNRTAKKSSYALTGLLILGLISLAVFMPLFRFTIDRPDLVAYRSLTRLGTAERALPGSAVEIFFQNTWNALTMFFWDNGDVWVHSIPHRPALDVVSAALFFLGVVLMALRYVRKRNWEDLFMLISIPMLLLPSILSLAFPNENPNLNRTSAAYVPVFLILAMGLEGLLGAMKRGLSGRMAKVVPALVGLALILVSARSNFDLVFNQYDRSERESGWNTPEMGAVVRRFDESFGRNQDAWVVAYPYWVDTRLVGIEAGYPTRDMAIGLQDLSATAGNPGNKLFLLNTEDSEGLSQLKSIYPDGRYWLYKSATPGKDFFIFLALSPIDFPQGMDPQGLLGGSDQGISP
jgi:hypothetical protein